MPSLILALLPALTLAVPTKVAILPVTAGEGVTEKTAAALGEAVAGQVRRVPGLQPITQQEIATLLNFDKQRSLLSCQSDSCLAEIGGALGVERLVFGSVSKLGESWLVTLKLMDVKKARSLAQSDRRLKKGSVDDVLDALPQMVGELFGAAPSSAPAVVAAAEPAKAEPVLAPNGSAEGRSSGGPLVRGPEPVKAAPDRPLPPSWADEPAPLTPESRAKLQLATDGKGHYFAFRPYWEETLLFAGDGKTFYLQRVFGGGATGTTEFDYTYWEPRAKARWQASFGLKSRQVYVQCGEEPTPLKLVPPAQAKKLLAKAKLFKPRWRRMGFALARDDAGTYYFVDRLREPDDTRDFRLYVGTRGKVHGVEVQDALLDDAGQVFITAAGRLKFSRGNANPTVEWVQGEKRATLSGIDIESQARFVYTELGAYAGEKLGTACDWAH
jgi:hypothetical protein